MHRFVLLAAAAAFTGLSVAQNDNIPTCALSCFSQAIGNTTCAITDAYCQCTSGQAKIASVLLPCLCTSGCSASDLMQVQHASNDICSAALSAKSSSYTPNTATGLVCSTAAASGSSSAVVGAAGSTTATASSGSATGSASSSAMTTTAAAGSSAASSAAAAATSSRAAAGKLTGYEAVWGLAGLAAVVL